MNRRELLQGALLTAAVSGVPAALAALPSDPLVSGVRYFSRCPDANDHHISGSIMGHPWGTKHPLSRFAAALEKHEEIANSEFWDFSWEVIP